VLPLRLAKNTEAVDDDQSVGFVQNENVCGLSFNEAEFGTATMLNEALVNARAPLLTPFSPVVAAVLLIVPLLPLGLESVALPFNFHQASKPDSEQLPIVGVLMLVVETYEIVPLTFWAQKVLPATE
jgi:hypothetical protein